MVFQGLNLLYSLGFVHLNLKDIVKKIIEPTINIGIRRPYKITKRVFPISLLFFIYIRCKTMILIVAKTKLNIAIPIAGILKYSIELNRYFRILVNPMKRKANGMDSRFFSFVFLTL
jgi:hypothetical protein